MCYKVFLTFSEKYYDLFMTSHIYKHQIAAVFTEPVH